MVSFEHLGRALEEKPGNKITDKLRSLYRNVGQNYRESYKETLEDDPQKFLLHRSNAEYNENESLEDEWSKLEPQYELLENDLQNLSNHHRLSEKELIAFSDEYKLLKEKGKIEELESFGLKVVNSEKDPRTAYEEWIEVSDSENVRSYASKGKRDKVRKLGEEMIPEVDITTFGAGEFDMKESLKHSGNFIDYRRHKWKIGIKNHCSEDWKHGDFQTRQKSSRLVESVLPYEVRHSTYDAENIETLIESRGLKQPDTVIVFGVPEEEKESHFKQVREIIREMEDPDRLIYGEGVGESITETMNSLDITELHELDYDGPPSRSSDFDHIDSEIGIDEDELVLGVAQDYTTPRNHRIAAEKIDSWNGPNNSFPFRVKNGREKGSSLSNYLKDAMSSRKPQAHDYSGELDLKDGNHFVIGTTFSKDMRDYRTKFVPRLSPNPQKLLGDIKESEITRTYLPQAIKDKLKETPAVDGEEV